MTRKQKKAQNLRAAKDKKMKKVAAGLAVVLAVVLAFEVPGMLKGSGGSSTPPPATTTTAGAPVASTPPATTPPTTAASAVPVSSTGSTALPNSDTAPRSGKAQLYAFSHFSGKDPFVQQVAATTQGQSAASSSTTSGGSSAATATATDASVKVAGSSSSARTLAATGSARISVNGRVQVVRVGASFPSSNPLFRLVAVSHGSARIGIASGKYSSGANTVSLASGKTLTLVDTADGVRYRIRLVSAA
jgi:hypothetical protein